MRKNLIILILMILVAIIFIFIFKDTLDANAIIEVAPKSSTLLVLIGVLYLLRGVLAIFPIMFAAVASGFLMSPMAAIVVNISGVTLMFSVSYMVGKRAGARIIKIAVERTAALQHFFEKQENNEFLTCMLLRIVPYLPGGFASYYLGARNVHYGKYILASVIGYLPQLMAYITIGSALTGERSSGLLMIAIIAAQMVLLVSFVLWRYGRRNLKPSVNSIDKSPSIIVKGD